MAKLKAKDMTPEQLEARHAKAKKRREAKKESNLKAIDEIVALLSDEQLQSLSKEARHFIAVCRGEFAVERNVYVPVEGDTLQSIFQRFPNISTKKLRSKCEDAGLAIDWANGIITKA